jgi:hypothetical protein
MTPGQRTQRFGSKSSPPLGASRSCRPSGSEPCPSAPALCSSGARRRSSRRSDAGPTTETRVSRPRTPQRRFPPTQRHPPSRRSRTDRRGTRPPLLRLTLLHRNRHPDGSCGRSRVIHARGPAWSPQRVPLTEPPGSADVWTLAGGPPAVCRGEPARLGHHLRHQPTWPSAISRAGAAVPWRFAVRDVALAPLHARR